MEYQEFIKGVQEKAGCDKELAVKATRAVLQTLSERISNEEAERLAAQLPRELQLIVREPELRGKFDIGEFKQRVSRREGVSVRQAEQDGRAVIQVLCRAVPGGELDDIVAQLPREYWPMFGKRSENID